jgi:hypothetical protein
MPTVLSHLLAQSHTLLGNNVAFTWGEGNKGKHRVADTLRWARLPSESVVYVDSIMTTVMFKSIFTTMPELICRIRVLSEKAVDENLDEDSQRRMGELCQFYLNRFQSVGGSAWAAWYISTTSDLASKLWDGFEIVRRFGRKDTLEWFAINLWQ